MVLEEIDVAVGCFLAVEGFNLVAKQTAVQADKALLGQFADERGDVLVLYVGVGVVLGAGGGVGRVAIVDEEAEFVGRFAVVLMALAVEHESFCGLEMAFRHQCHLHLVLYVLHAHAVAEAQVVGDGFQLLRVERVAGRGKGFENGTFDFVERERLCCAVALGDNKGVVTHRA